VKLRRHSIVFCVSLIVLAPILSALAAPWDALPTRKKVDADPHNMYPITQSSGPWMIMAATFQGETAQKQAQALVYELRSKFNLPAYTYEKTFDYTKPEQGRGVTPDGRPKMMKTLQKTADTEFAVLVGDYQTVDDDSAQKVLATLKKLDPACMHSQLPGTDKTAAGGDHQTPLRHAMVVTNPLLPREYFATKGIDKFVQDMNKDVPYSLLDCPGKYSVKVATFTGAAEIDPMRIKAMEQQKDTGKSKLAEAAEKAHTLTMYLRDKKYEAYEFHDRQSSIVCVGSFQAIGMPRADGKIEIDPTIHKIMTIFGADQGGLATGTPLKPRNAGGIALDIQPMPVEVPRRSISADYQRSMRDER
jgi:hypothetical protein